jgi:hypothetical protein
MCSTCSPYRSVRFYIIDANQESGVSRDTSRRATISNAKPLNLAVSARAGYRAGQSDLLNSLQVLNCLRFVSRNPHISSWCSLPKMSR